METCATETGLLKKKPCGNPAVAKCDNCEMPLCGKHALAQLSATQQRTGKFMCAECDRAQREAAKVAPAARSRAPAAAPAKPAAPAPKPPAAPAKPDDDSLGGIDFTPSKK